MLPRRKNQQGVSPFRGIDSLQDEMNRLFNDFFSPDERLLGEVEFSPSVDISENKNEVVVKADLPGMEEKDIDVSIAGDLLTIKGERKDEKEEKEDDYYRRERVYGSFSRQITLPKHIKREDVKAKFKNGVLTITLPKSEDYKEKEVKIELEK